MIHQSLVEKYGLKLTRMQNGQSFIHNVGVYEWPNEAGMRVLVSDGDKEGNPLSKGVWMILIVNGNKWQSFNISETFIKEIGLPKAINILLK